MNSTIAKPIDSKKKYLILSIDGGGIRGLIPAQFLALLEKDLSASLYDTFDMYAGSSVGSFIALGISALQYRGENLIELFNQKNINLIFKKSWLSCLSFIYGSKYQGKGKREVLDNIFGDRKFLDIKKFVLITAYDFIQKKLIVFKSHGGMDASYNPNIAEVADASSAAPTYFPSVKSSANPPRWLIDGGIAENNPSLAIFSTAIHHGIPIENIRILSLGTGSSTPFREEKDLIGKASQTWGGLNWLSHGIIDNLTNGNMDEAEYALRELLKNNFYRVEYPLKIADVAMDNTSKENMEALLDAGKKWYEKERQALLKWLNQAPKKV